MKKLIAIVLAVFMMLSLCACNNEDEFVLNDTLNDIITSMTDEFATATENIENRTTNIVENMGDSFDSYIDKKDDIADLFYAIEYDSKDLFSRVGSYSLEYYENIAIIGIEEKEEWEYALNTFNDKVDESLRNYYDVCFESIYAIDDSCYELIRTEFFDDNIDSDTYFKEKSEMEDEFERIHTVIYDANLAATNKINDEIFMVYNGFNNGVIDIKAILEEEIDKPITDE